jgi:hypothetical protein
MTRYDEIGVGYARGRRTDPRWRCYDTALHNDSRLTRGSGSS